MDASLLYVADDNLAKDKESSAGAEHTRTKPSAVGAEKTKQEKEKKNAEPRVLGTKPIDTKS